MTKVHRDNKFDQKPWLKRYKNDFKKYFFKLMNNSVFGETMENMRKHWDMKLVTTEARRNYLVSEPNYHTTNFFSENLLPIEIQKETNIYE